MTDPRAASHRSAILDGTAGNIMEWYDLAVYGYFDQTIGKHFFPAQDPTTSLIASFGAFAAGFLMRPLGGVVFGHIGDRFGRKHALALSVLAMAIPTFLIGLLPGYATLGPAAAVLLVLLHDPMPVGRRGVHGLDRLPGRGGTAGALPGSALSRENGSSQTAINRWIRTNGR